MCFQLLLFAYNTLVYCLEKTLMKKIIAGFFCLDLRRPSTKVIRPHDLPGEDVIVRFCFLPSELLPEEEVLCLPGLVPGEDTVVGPKHRNLVYARA